MLQDCCLSIVELSTVCGARSSPRARYQEHFLTFQTDPASVSNEWLRALESFALPLFQARPRTVYGRVY